MAGKGDTDKPGGLAAASSPVEPERFLVKLLKPHTHARTDYKSGDEIQITAEQRAWLQGLHVVGAEPQEK